MCPAHFLDCKPDFAGGGSAAVQESEIHFTDCQLLLRDRSAAAACFTQTERSGTFEKPIVCLQVALAINSMSMCGLIQASVFKISHSFICEQEEEAFMIEAYDFAQSFQPGHQPPQPRRSFSKFWDMRCEAEWRRAFYMFSTGLAVRVLDLLMVSWICIKPGAMCCTYCGASLTLLNTVQLFKSLQASWHCKYSVKNLGSA